MSEVDNPGVGVSHMVDEQDDAALAGVIGWAVDKAIERYFQDCRRRIPQFVTTHFQYPGAWQTNRHAFGWDFLRSPLNLLWAPVYVSSVLLHLLFRKTGPAWLANLLDRLPSGLQTDVQKYVATKIHDELLQCSTPASHSNGLQKAIREEIDSVARTTTPGAGVYELDDPGQQHLGELNEQLAALSHDATNQISVARTASSDIANSTLAVLIGALWFNKFVAGGIALGVLLAAWVTRQIAIHNFWLGDSVGGLFYRLFPPPPSLSVLFLSVLSILLVLALLCAFWGLLTDPLQSRIGLHSRRLHKLVDKLEQDLKARTSGSFRPRDQYLARILEVVDALRSPFV